MKNNVSEDIIDIFPFFFYFNCTFLTGLCIFIRNRLNMMEECLGTDSSIVILYTYLLVLLGQTLVLSSCIHSCLFYWVVSLCTHFVAFKTDPEMQRL